MKRHHCTDCEGLDAEDDEDWSVSRFCHAECEVFGRFVGNEECTENPIRLYSLDEITEIFYKLGLRICNSFADFSGKPSSDNDIQLMVYSIRE